MDSDFFLMGEVFLFFNFIVHLILEKLQVNSDWRNVKEDLYDSEQIVKRIFPIIVEVQMDLNDNVVDITYEIEEQMVSPIRAFAIMTMIGVFEVLKDRLLGIVLRSNTEAVLSEDEAKVSH